jgi:hypothetical protein
MRRAAALLACSFILLSTFALLPDFPGARARNASAAPKTKKGKIKAPHRVLVQSGVDLVLVFPTDDLDPTDTVDPSDVTARFTGYNLTCTAATVLSSGGHQFLQAKFSVTRMLPPRPKQAKKDEEKDKIFGTGDLTVTLNSMGDGPTSVTNIPAYGG